MFQFHTSERLHKIKAKAVNEFSIPAHRKEPQKTHTKILPFNEFQWLPHNPQSHFCIIYVL